MDLPKNLNNIIAEQFLHIKDILKAFCLHFKQFPMTRNGAFFCQSHEGPDCWNASMEQHFIRLSKGSDTEDKVFTLQSCPSINVNVWPVVCKYILAHQCEQEINFYSRLTSDWLLEDSSETDGGQDSGPRDLEVMKQPCRLPETIHLLVYFRSLSVVCFPVCITTVK